MDAPVLLTGATGYIGGRLLRRFEEDGRAVRCMVRQAGRLHTTASTTEVAPGDCLDEASLDRALVGVQCAVEACHNLIFGGLLDRIARRAASQAGEQADSGRIPSRVSRP